MKSRHISRNRSYAMKEDSEEVAVDQLSKVVVLGDVIWVQLRDSYWWPAQIVDDNSVSQRFKPRDRSSGHALVRLYGSYKYMYVDPVTCSAEFKNILEQNNGNYKEIFKKSLDQELANFKSGRAKGKGSESEGKSEELTARRLKVMQSLGLMAPSGSPFNRKGHVNPNLSPFS